MLQLFDRLAGKGTDLRRRCRRCYGGIRAYVMLLSDLQKPAELRKMTTDWRYEPVVFHIVFLWLSMSGTKRDIMQFRDLSCALLPTSASLMIWLIRSSIHRIWIWISNRHAKQTNTTNEQEISPKLPTTP